MSNAPFTLFRALYLSKKKLHVCRYQIARDMANLKCDLLSIPRARCCPVIFV